MKVTRVWEDLKTRNVEIRTCEDTKDASNLQYGFVVEDTLALLQMDNLFLLKLLIYDFVLLRFSYSKCKRIVNTEQSGCL